MKHSKPVIPYLLMAGLLLTNTVASAQLMKKLKDKVQEKVENAAGLGGNKSQSTSATPASSTGSAKNKVGGGLKSTTPPDVIAEMQEAEKAHTASNYSDARYALQQALVGVEIQIGHQVLAALPPVINDLTKDTTRNVVMSTQWGWNNLTIQTTYRKDPDKEMTISIGNNSIYGGLAAMYFANAGYVQANNQDQNIKQTRVKGNKAIIQYEDSKGYTLIMPLGQTSLIVWECVNFATEDEVMNAANKLDIDGIKKMLGEQ
jgi:hypothetical protein